MVRIAVRFCGGFSLLCIARVRPGRRDQRTCLMQLSCRRQISAIHSAILGVIKRHSPPRPRLSILAASSTVHRVAEALKDKRDLSNEHGKLMQYFSWLASLLAVVQSFVSKTHALRIAMTIRYQRQCPRRTSVKISPSRSAVKKHYSMAEEFQVHWCLPFSISLARPRLCS